jgi:hypothetical protein
MRVGLVFLTKWVTAVIAFTIGLDVFFNATVIDILSFSVTVTILSYIIGDRIIYPAYGNTLALWMDFIISYTSVWVFGNVYLNSAMQIAWGSVISAVIITLGEWFVHRYILSDQVMPHERGKKLGHLAFGTEFAEENDIHKMKLNKKED